MSSETLPIPSQTTEDSAWNLPVIREEGLYQRKIKDPFFIAANYDLSEIKPYQWHIKRTIDILGSTVGVLLILPFLILVGLIIRLESKGPIIYKQKRIGKNGKEFEMYKFRSMRADADQILDQLMDQNEMKSGMFKMFNDPRITQVGKWIRKFSIDELPQLFNVIKGDMSLVGPRPPIGRELMYYQNWHFFRFATLPGLTGLWQVSGRSNVKEFDHVVQMDYQYIKNWNLWLDFKLILKTFPVVLLGRDTA